MSNFSELSYWNKLHFIYSRLNIDRGNDVKFSVFVSRIMLSVQALVFTLPIYRLLNELYSIRNRIFELLGNDETLFQVLYVALIVTILIIVKLSTLGAVKVSLIKSPYTKNDIRIRVVCLFVLPLSVAVYLS